MYDKIKNQFKKIPHNAILAILYNIVYIASERDCIICFKTFFTSSEASKRPGC